MLRGWAHGRPAIKRATTGNHMACQPEYYSFHIPQKARTFAKFRKILSYENDVQKKGEALRFPHTCRPPSERGSGSSMLLDQTAIGFRGVSRSVRSPGDRAHGQPRREKCAATGVFVACQSHYNLAICKKLEFSVNFSKTPFLVSWTLEGKKIRGALLSPRTRKPPCRDRAGFRYVVRPDRDRYQECPKEKKPQKPWSGLTVNPSCMSNKPEDVARHHSMQISPKISGDPRQFSRGIRYFPF